MGIINSDDFLEQFPEYFDWQNYSLLTFINVVKQMHEYVDRVVVVDASFIIEDRCKLFIEISSKKETHYVWLVMFRGDDYVYWENQKNQNSGRWIFNSGITKKTLNKIIS